MFSDNGGVLLIGISSCFSPVRLDVSPGSLVETSPFCSSPRSSSGGIDFLLELLSLRFSFSCSGSLLYAESAVFSAGFAAMKE